MRDNTDRNRTSPFAFTGQKFEFRAIGSSASVSLANTVLSAAVADSIDILVADIEKEMKSTKDQSKAILQVLRKYVIETEPIRFEGNNYSDEWEKEAAKRGLPNIKRTAYALDALMDKKNIEMLVRQGVYKEIEIEGRYNTKVEQYITALEIEADTFINLINTTVLPTAIAYQSQLVSLIKDIKSLGDVVPAAALAVEEAMLKAVSEKISSISAGLKTIESILAEAGEIHDEAKKSKLIADKLVDALNEARVPADELEGIVPDDLWPLPKYSEMLFIM